MAGCAPRAACAILHPPHDRKLPMGTKARANAPASRTGNVIRDSALGLVPETLAEIIALNGAVWHSPLVAPALLEMIRLRNARTVNCVYCKAVRYEVARSDGLTEERAAMIDAKI